MNLETEIFKKVTTDTFFISVKNVFELNSVSSLQKLFDKYYSFYQEHYDLTIDYASGKYLNNDVKNLSDEELKRNIEELINSFNDSEVTKLGALVYQKTHAFTQEFPFSKIIKLLYEERFRTEKSKIKKKLIENFPDNLRTDIPKFVLISHLKKVLKEMPNCTDEKEVCNEKNTSNDFNQKRKLKPGRKKKGELAILRVIAIKWLSIRLKNHDKLFDYKDEEDFYIKIAELENLPTPKSFGTEFRRVNACFQIDEVYLKMHVKEIIKAKESIPLEYDKARSYLEKLITEYKEK
ncbi:hypothetical protein [Aquimarina macrocephali]|uniref:hypothetical protein n=1 Tax=Aquimarina macrocephali TaxID=666563 RepID=UPI003F6621EA